MDKFTLGMIVVAVVVISCTIFTYANYSSCDDCYTEIGLLERSETRSIRFDGYDYYIDNINDWHLSAYYGHECEITFMSGCGQMHIIGIKTMQS